MQAVVRATVAVAEEGIARRHEGSALTGVRRRQSAVILRRHLPVERGQAGVPAHGDFAPRAGIAAVEARPRSGRRRRRRLGRRLNQTAVRQR